ncbi:MAG: metal-dependent hydrolase [Fervidicoccaceae archaeon]
MTHVLVGIGISIFVMTRLREFDQLMIAYALLFSALPDLDFSLKHRAMLHNIFAAFLLTLPLTYFSEGYLISMGLTTLSWTAFFASSLIAYLSHLLLDMLTKAGVSLFWPLSGKYYRLASLRYDDPIANSSLSALGVILILIALI